MQNESRKRLLKIIYAAMSIAMVTVLTYTIKIPSLKGYVNFGDTMIFVAAALFGRTTGFLAGGFGSALADVIGGYTSFVPGTFVIKGIEGLICAMLVRRDDNDNINRNSLIISVIVSAAWMVFGYFMYEYRIIGMFFNEEFGMAIALPSLPGNIVQGAVSAVAGFLLIMAVKRTKVKFGIEEN